jgi:hypothetical protein
LFIISGACIYAVKPDPKKPSDEILEDTECINGVKKIKQLGVFAITTFSSIFAYVWLWICILDQQVTITEAVLTFIFFPILVITAYCMDAYNAKEKDDDQEGDAGIVLTRSYVDVMRVLIKDKTGAKQETKE